MKKEVIRLIIDILNIPIYWLSFFVPKSKNIWVFGSWFGNDYADNSKALYEFSCKHGDVRSIWLTKNYGVYNQLKSEGRTVFFTYSIKGYYYSVRAKYIFVSTGIHDVNKYTSIRKHKIQLWHGTPLKKILADDKYTFQKKVFWKKIILPFNYIKYNTIIAPSEIVKNIFLSAFLEYGEIKILGYPRNDILVNENNSDEKIIMYLPTHRGIGNEKIKKLFNDFDIRGFDTLLKTINYKLFIKLHYYDLKLLTFKNTDNIKFIDYPCDIYDLLMKTSILITDYSSIFFDYLLTDRPVIFAPFDYDDYINSEREFYFDYNKITPGPKCKNWEEVFNVIKDIIRGDDNYIKERKKINSMFNYFKDGNSSKRVYEYIKSIS